MAATQRIEIGFEGGQVLPVRLDEKSLRKLREALSSGGWHELETEDGELSIYLGKVAFLRIDSGGSRVGFASE